MNSAFQVAACCLGVACFPWAEAKGQSRLEDDAAPRLMYNLSEVRKAHVLEAFLSISPQYCSPFSMDEVMQQLMGLRKGLISYDEKAMSVRVLGDGAQYLDFTFSLALDSPFGMVAIIKGKEFVGEEPDQPIDQKLLRIKGGWLDLNTDWKAQVNASRYEVIYGAQSYVFQLYWVKNNPVVFGYGYPKGKATVTFPIRGLNEKQGELTLWLKDVSFSLRKRASEKGVVWQSSSSGKKENSLRMKKQ